MCNLYSITTNQAAIIALFRAMNHNVGNLPPMPGVFPDYSAPIVGNAKVSGDTVKNFSAHAYRRVERTAQLAFGVDPLDAIARLKPLLADIPNVIAAGFRSASSVDRVPGPCRTYVIISKRSKASP